MNDCTENSQFFEFEDDNLQKSGRQESVSAMDVDDEELATGAGATAADEASAAEAQLPIWSIDDDTLFEPYGLINHSNGLDKSVFVTWHDEYVLNFRFKKSKKTKRIEMAKVRIPLLPDAGEIREVHILDYNTLTLMSTGRIYYFSSVKSMQRLGWLNDVRCFARAPNGFSIIRHDAESRRLLLEVYNDVANIGKSESTKTHSYDITYDEENIFNCAWLDDKFTLHSHEVKAGDVPFVQQLMGSENNVIKKGETLHIFSVNGHVFLLTANETSENSPTDTPKYQITLLAIYATTVSFIKLLPQQNLCLVFLTAGCIDMWHVSSVTGLKQRQMHYTGTEFIDFDATSANGDFYYTDGDQLARLRFEYNATTDDCSVSEEVKFVEGMLACTWVQQLQQLVCLSMNNIFYRIDFQSTTRTVEQEVDVDELNDLTPAEVDTLRRKASVVAELQEKPAKLHALIECEFKKQQLIAVGNKTELYGRLFSASLRYCLHLPAFNASTMLFHTGSSMQLTNESYFALIEIKLKAHNEIFQSASWQLCVFHEPDVHKLYVPIDQLLNKRCIVVVPLTRKANCKLEKFSLRFATLVTFKSQCEAIILPIELNDDAETYKALFSQTTQAANTSNAESLQDIVDSFRQRLGLEKNPAKAQFLVVQKFKLPASDSFEKLLATLGGDEIACDLTETQIKLYFMNMELLLCYQHDNHILTLSSTDATAIYYLKLHALLNWQKLSENAARPPAPMADEEKTRLLQFVMKCQCELERCCDTQTQADQTEDEIKASESENLKQLMSIYRKMRDELY